MSAQTRYGYSSPIGAAGGIVDLAPYAIDAFLNEEDTGKMQFGMGVVTGSRRAPASSCLSRPALPRTSRA